MVKYVANSAKPAERQPSRVRKAPPRGPRQTSDEVTKIVQAVRKVLSVQQIFGTPGASLTWGVKGATVGEVEAGIRGERFTGEVLNELVRRDKRYHVFHSISKPGKWGDTDHILIRGNTVFIIDSKMWRRGKTYVINSRGRVFRGSVRFAGGDVKMGDSVDDWRKILPRTCKIIGVVCIAQTDVAVQYDNNWTKAPYALVPIADLPNFVNSRAGEEPNRLSFGCEMVAYHLLTHLVKPNPNPLTPQQLPFPDGFTPLLP